MRSEKAEGKRKTRRRSLPSVEDFFSEVFDSECGIVGATFGFAGNRGFDDFADEDGMVALFDGVDEAAFEDGRGVGQDQRVGVDDGRRDRGVCALFFSFFL